MEDGTGQRHWRGETRYPASGALYSSQTSHFRLRCELRLCDALFARHGVCHFSMIIVHCVGQCGGAGEEMEQERDLDLRGRPRPLWATQRRGSAASAGLCTLAGWRRGSDASTHRRRLIATTPSRSSCITSTSPLRLCLALCSPFSLSPFSLPFSRVLSRLPLRRLLPLPSPSVAVHSVGPVLVDYWCSVRCIPPSASVVRGPLWALSGVSVSVG